MLQTQRQNKLECLTKEKISNPSTFSSQAVTSLHEAPYYAPLKGWLLALLANNRLAWKSLPGLVQNILDFLPYQKQMRLDAAILCTEK